MEAGKCGLAALEHGRLRLGRKLATRAHSLRNYPENLPLGLNLEPPHTRLPMDILVDTEYRQNQICVWGST